jgi:hypothetical protein
MQSRLEEDAMDGERSKPESRDEQKQDHSAVDAAVARGGRPRRAIPMRLEMHHVDGRKINRKRKFPVCPICHRVIHKHALEAGADLSKPPPTLLHRLATVLDMRGSLYIDLGQAMLLEANEIESLIAGLDEDLPNWRRVPEAK